MSKKLKKHVAEKYIESAIVQKEIINRLMERLSFINLSPRKVADLGSGVGLSTESLILLKAQWSLRKASSSRKG